MALHANLDDDDYVAKLLAEDAQASSRKYASIGLQALRPKRPTHHAPKPNTRFLRSIIRETDNHNATLKKKEDLEARLRLSDYHYKSSTPGPDPVGYNARARKRRRREDSRDHRPRELDNPPGHLSLQDGAEDSSGPRLSKSSDSGRRDRKDGPLQEARTRQSRRHLGRGRPSDSSDDTQGDRGRGHRRRRAERSSSGRDNNYHRHRREAHDSRRHRTRRKDHDSRSRSPDSIRGSPRQRSSGLQRQTHTAVTTSSHSNNAKSLVDRTDDSDPLEDLVGPLPPTDNRRSATDAPPLRSRGRGAYKSSPSAMDAHFSSNYDPSLDLHHESEPEDEKDDWDMALEALRDRERWKQKGTERLRAAGFAEVDIKKWEDSGREKGAEDVKWAATGQAREWDIGKVVEPESPRKTRANAEGPWNSKNGGFIRDFKKALG